MGERANELLNVVCCDNMPTSGFFRDACMKTTPNCSSEPLTQTSLPKPRIPIFKCKINKGFLVVEFKKKSRCHQGVRLSNDSPSLFFEEGFVHFLYLPYAHTPIRFNLTNIVPIFHVKLSFICLVPTLKISNNLIEFPTNVI